VALNKGNADCTSGLSKRIYDRMKVNIEAKPQWGDLPQSDKDNILNAKKEEAWVYAQSDVEEYQANAEVKSVSTNVDTNVLPGTFNCPVAPGPVLGATTGSGSGTQTGSGIVE
jgi:hypothetical protein